MVEVSTLGIILGAFVFGIGSNLSGKFIEYLWDTRGKRGLQKIDKVLFNRVVEEQKKESETNKLIIDQLEDLQRQMRIVQTSFHGTNCKGVDNNNETKKEKIY
jgi:hypothetical protein